MDFHQDLVLDPNPVRSSMQDQPTITLSFRGLPQRVRVCYLHCLDCSLVCLIDKIHADFGVP